MLKSKRQKILLIILSLLFIISAVIMTIALVTHNKSENAESKNNFIPPSFDENAISGTPTVDSSLRYEEIYAEGMAYKIYICRTPHIEDNKLTIYFTSPAENEKNLKIRVYDENGNTLGETGLIKPDEYIKYVTLKENVDKDTILNIKVMGYEPETYMSAGVVTVGVKIT